MSKSRKMTGVLYLIPTVISPGTDGEVITAPVKSVTQSLKHYLVENIRTARRYLKKINPNIEIDKITFTILNKDTTSDQLHELMRPLLRGEDCGLISESGNPCIADPGHIAVAFAHQHKIMVRPLVGPNSILLALISSGFNGQHFCFHGYLPIQKKELVSKLKEMENSMYSSGITHIFMETPYRNQGLFKTLLNNLKKDTKLCIAKDLTGSNEYIMTQSIALWRSNLPKIEKIPMIFLIGK